MEDVIKYLKGVTDGLLEVTLFLASVDTCNEKLEKIKESLREMSGALPRIKNREEGELKDYLSQTYIDRHENIEEIKESIVENTKESKIEEIINGDTVKEFQTQNGAKIDFYTGETIIIEVKPHPDRATIGQVQAYKAEIEATFCDLSNVVIIGKAFSEEFKRTAKSLNWELYEYERHFIFKKVDLIDY